MSFPGNYKRAWGAPSIPTSFYLENKKGKDILKVQGYNIFPDSSTFVGHKANNKLIEGTTEDKTKAVLEEVLKHANEIRKPQQFLVHWYGPNLRIEPPIKQDTEFDYNISFEDIKNSLGYPQDIEKPESWY
jgi:hypothetical protein